MKHLLWLLFTILVIGCSKEDKAEIETVPTPKQQEKTALIDKSLAQDKDKNSERIKQYMSIAQNIDIDHSTRIQSLDSIFKIFSIKPDTSYFNDLKDIIQSTENSEIKIIAVANIILLPSKDAYKYVLTYMNNTYDLGIKNTEMNFSDTTLKLIINRSTSSLKNTNTIDKKIITSTLVKITSSLIADLATNETDDLTMLDNNSLQPKLDHNSLTLIWNKIKDREAILKLKREDFAINLADRTTDAGKILHKALMELKLDISQPDVAMQIYEFRYP